MEGLPVILYDVSIRTLCMVDAVPVGMDLPAPSSSGRRTLGQDRFTLAANFSRCAG